MPNDDKIEFGDGDGDGDPGDGDGDGDGDPGDGDGDGDVTCTPIVDSITITDDTDLASVACVEVVLGDLTVGPTTQLIDLQALASLREVGGTATIVGNLALTSLEGLEGLESVTWLHIRRNRNLSDLHGLDGLVALDQLTVASNAGLTSLAGLPSELAPRTLEIAENLLLASLDGLPVFVDPSTSDALLVDIDGNPALIDLGGLSDCCAAQAVDLTVASNDALTDLGGLEAFTRLERLRLYDDRGLLSLAGLDALSSLGTLDIAYDHCSEDAAPVLPDLSGAPNLADLDVLQVQWVDSLTSLAGLGAITELGKLQVRNNAALPWEAVLALEAQTAPGVVDTCGGVGGPTCAAAPCPNL